jgi:putative salt-induced outer membrane protein YdiY
MRIPLPAFTRTLAICFVLLFACRAAHADEVHLKNGDRITGTVVSLVSGTLTFDTGHGKIDLPWMDVTGLTVTAPVVVTVAGQPERTVALTTTPDGRLLLQAGTAVSLGDVVAIRRPERALIVTGAANAGFLATGGNTDVNSLRLDGELVARAMENRYTASGIVNRASDKGVETAQNATGSVRYDRFVSKRLYFNGSGIFTNDRFRDLDLRTALGVGIGYQVASNALVKLGVEGGYGYVNERFATEPNQSYHAVRETVSLDVTPLGPRITLFHRNDGFFGFTGDDNLFVHTQNGVRVGLFGGLVTTLQYDVDYDRSPAPGRKRTDTSLGITFGYRFGV